MENFSEYASKSVKLAIAATAINSKVWTDIASNNIQTANEILADSVAQTNKIQDVTTVNGVYQQQLAYNQDVAKKLRTLVDTNVAIASKAQKSIAALV